MNKSSILLRAAIVSDIHLDINHPNPQVPVALLCRALKSAKKQKADAFISVGDTTSRGNKINWDYGRKAFKKVPNAAKEIILTVGNHDCWSDAEDEYAGGIGEYYSAVSDLAGTKLVKPYFSTYIGGYGFICLGNESNAGCEANISDEQAAWLKAELEKATADGKPAFVFCHQSLNGRHGLPRTWDKIEDPNADPLDGGIGEKSEKIAEILKSFKNVFYFSGHSHMGFCGEEMKAKEGYASFENEDGLHLINLPSLCCGNHHGNKNSLGMGLELEIEKDCVTLFPKSFVLGKRIRSISIKDGKPYYQVKIEG